MELAAYPNFNPVGVAPYVFYCIALVLVILYSAFTGWGLELMSEEEYQAEYVEIYGTESIESYGSDGKEIFGIDSKGKNQVFLK